MKLHKVEEEQLLKQIFAWEFVWSSKKIDSLFFQANIR